MSDERKVAALFVVYLAGALLTNSYCQVYRWQQWDNQSFGDGFAFTALTTVGWPVYWASRGATWIVGKEPTAELVNE